MIHDLKTWPEPFVAVLDGSKPFEIRKNDRGFNVGDVLRLREWDPCTTCRTVGSTCCDSTGGIYTGREVTARVTYIARGWGMPDDMVVMGLDDIDLTPTRLGDAKRAVGRLREHCADYGYGFEAKESRGPAIAATMTGGTVVEIVITVRVEEPTGAVRE